MAKGAAVTAHVTNTRPKCSPLIQGGLEILIIVTVERDNADGMGTSKEKVWSVNLPIGEDDKYKDESDSISITIGTDEYKNNDCSMWRVFFCVPFLQI